MRSIPILFLLAFGVFYLLITFGAIKAITQLLNLRKKKLISSIVIIISTFVLISLILLYVWPENIRTAKNYSLYFFINGIFSVDIVIKTPLSLFYLLGFVFNKKNRIIISNIGLIISITLGLFVTYGILFETNRIVEKRIELKFNNLPSNFDGYKIVQISDIHIGSFNKSDKLLKKVQNKISEINPDLIFFTGDLVNNYSFELNGLKPLFEKITKPGKSFSILGNHDYGNYSYWQNQEAKSNNFRVIVDSHKDFGFKLLRNENAVIKNENDSIFIIGVENWGHPPFPQYANLEKALVGVPENAFKILLTHDPAHWMAQVVNKQPINLTLAGHTHGFQFGIIKAGIPFSLAYFTRKEWGGLYESNNQYLYVNTGLGVIGLPWRINMPPEITTIILKH